MTGLQGPKNRKIITCLTICQLALSLLSTDVALAARAYPKPGTPGIPASDLKSTQMQDVSVRVKPVSETTANQIAIEQELAGAAMPPITSSEQAALRTQVVRGRYSPRIAMPMLLTMPSSGTGLLDLGFGGGSVSSQTSTMAFRSTSFSTGFGTSSNRATQTSEGTRFDSRLTGAFGFMRYFYAGVSGQYSNSSLNTKNRFSDNTEVRGKTDTDGFSEPELFIGAHLLMRETRIFAQLNGTIPFGAASGKLSGQNLTQDRLSGGSSITPQVGVISDIGSIRAIGKVGYSILQDREKKVTGGSTTQELFEKGGNSLLVSAGLELPRLWNVGLMIDYANIDQVTSTMKSTTRTTMSMTPSSKLGGTLYGNVPVTRRLSVVPQGSFIKTMGDGSATDQGDVFQGGMNLRFVF